MAWLGGMYDIHQVYSVYETVVWPATVSLTCEDTWYVLIRTSLMVYGAY